VRELIKGLAGEHTIILSTHILSEASQVCGRILIINNGHIVAEDTPERLTANLEGNARVLVRLQQTPENAETELAKLDGISAVAQTADGAFELSCAAGQDRRAEIAAMVVQRGWGLLELRPLVMGLEEIFLKLTQEGAPSDGAPEAEDASDNAEEEAENHA
jgi:ABC-2 type transport system ATP-binding protein